jgi:hypothetical protein
MAAQSDALRLSGAGSDNRFVAWAMGVAPPGVAPPNEVASSDTASKTVNPKRVKVDGGIAASFLNLKGFGNPQISEAFRTNS